MNVKDLLSHASLAIARRGMVYAGMYGFKTRSGITAAQLHLIRMSLVPLQHNSPCFVYIQYFYKRTYTDGRRRGKISGKDAFPKRSAYQWAACGSPYTTHELETANID
jgi:hypothetical protein